MTDLVPKGGWRTHRFDEMSSLINDRIDNPEEAGVDRYVGLEHLDSDSLRIRRWGSPGDVTATKLLFRRGDIIFGRRRVYQRKLAVADFDGICSAHAMVLRAKPDVVLPEFLPFFMQSDIFMERAKEISVGSLSPTINWKSLAEQEFALPPLDEQRRIAAAMQAAWRAADALREAEVALEWNRAAVLKTVADRMTNRYRTAPLASIAEVKYGLTVGPDRRGKSPEAAYLRVANVLRGSFDLGEVKKIGPLPGDEQYRLARGDILLVEGHANVAEIARAALVDETTEGLLHQNHLIRVRCSDAVLPQYVAALINSPHGMRYFQSRAKSSSGLNTINSTVVREYDLPLPPRTIQESLVGDLATASAGKSLIQQRVRALSALAALLLNEMGAG